LKLVKGKIEQIPGGGRYMNFSNVFGGGNIICGISLRNGDSVFPEKLGSLLPKGTKVITPLQTHSSSVSLIGEVTDAGFTPSGDAFVTGHPKVCLTVSVADCQTLYLCDPDLPAIGLAHLGWRGVVGGIVENSIACFTANFNCGADRIHALLSPSIGRCCYQVTPEVAVLFPKNSTEVREGKLYLDLRSVVRGELTTCGVGDDNIFSTENCTSCERELFFSHRVEGKASGRMLAFIQIRG